MSQKIIKLAKRKFNVSWTEVEDSNQKIIVDFNPIINHFNLKNDFVLLHWQAKPYGLRRWGIYASTDNYYGVDYDKVAIEPTGKLLQIKENKNAFPPSAVILFENSKVKCNENNFLITSTP